MLVLYDVLQGGERLVADLQSDFSDVLKAELEQGRVDLRRPLVRVGVVDQLFLQFDREEPEMTILLLLVHHEDDTTNRIVLNEL